MSEAKEPVALSALFGAEWRPLHAPEPGQELVYAAAACRAAGGTHFVLVESAGETQVGCVGARFGPATRLAGQLLASVVGAKEICTLHAIDQAEPNPYRAKTMLFVGRHGDDGRVAVAVLNGAPVFEVVGQLDEVLRRAHEFCDKLASGGLLLVQSEVQEDFEPLQKAVPSAYRQVDSLPFDAQWATRTGELRAVGLPRRAVAMVVGGAALLALPLAWIGQREWAKRKLVAEAQRQAQERGQTDATAFVALQRQAFGQLTALAPAADAARMAFEFARRVLDDRAGFAVSKVTINPRETVVHYTRTNKRKTFLDFVTHTDEGTPAFDVTKLDEAKVSYPPLAWDKLPQLDLTQSVDSAAIVLDLGTLAQKSALVGVHLTVGAPQSPLNPEQLAKVDTGELLRGKLGRRSGAWSATGPVDLFVPLCEVMPKACSLSELEIELKRDGDGTPADTFRAIGRYFVGWT